MKNSQARTGQFVLKKYGHWHRFGGEKRMQHSFCHINLIQEKSEWEIASKMAGVQSFQQMEIKFYDELNERVGRVVNVCQELPQTLDDKEFVLRSTEQSWAFIGIVLDVKSQETQHGKRIITVRGNQLQIDSHQRDVAVRNWSCVTRCAIRIRIRCWSFLLTLHVEALRCEIHCGDEFQVNWKTSPLRGHRAQIASTKRQGTWSCGTLALSWS